MSGRAVGVIGGMGPAATLLFLARLQALTPAKGDQDHLRVFLDLNPHVPDRNLAGGRGPSPAPVLARMAKGLERAGADFLVMPCNAAHAFAPAITEAVRISFIDLIETATEAALVFAPARVGLLAADGCLKAGLYQRAFAARGVDCVVCEPQAQATFMEVIYQVKGGRTGPEQRAGLKALALGLTRKGAQVVVAACTEVPLALGPEDVATPLVDSLEALAQRTVEVALEGSPSVGPSAPGRQR